MSALRAVGARGVSFATRRAACFQGCQQRLISCTVHDPTASEAVSGSGTAGNMGSVRPRRPVVTAFVKRDDGKLLVVKRSDKVSTYQQHWGGVSGGVEGDESLISRALTEISEEVGLTASQLKLVTFGRPLPVDDGNKHFLVYPFLFHLIHPSATVTLNWENTDYDWVAPSLISQLQHVPLLPETVLRLLLPPYMQQHVDYLTTDRQHGAAQLAAYVLNSIQSTLAEEEMSLTELTSSTSSSSTTPGRNATAAAAAADYQQQQQQQPHQPRFDIFMEAYSNFCFHMATARPSMAAVANAAAAVLLQLQQEVAARADAFEPTVGLARLALADSVRKLSQQLQQQQSATISNTAALLKPGMTVMTTSLSSTAAAALISAHQQATAAAPAAGGTHQPLAAAPAEVASKAATLTANAADSGAESDVDDPNFWPSSSGIGRQAATDPVFSSPMLDQLAKRPGGAGGKLGLAVYICESRPLCEGVIMARQLAAAGLDITLITDAQACVFIDQVDIVMFGADAVCPGGVVNKVGSKLLALAGRAAGVPVVAVTDSMKISPGPVSVVALPNTVISAGEEEKDAEEVVRSWDHSIMQQIQGFVKTYDGDADISSGNSGQDNQEAAAQASEAAAAHTPAAAEGGVSSSMGGGSICIRNVYFESVPLDCLTGLVTDKGLLTQADVAALIKKRVQEYQEAFGLAAPMDTVAS